MPVVFSAEALADLAAIRTYIGMSNPNTASRVAIQSVAACDRLESMPERGRPGFTPETRELTAAWPYVVVHRLTEGAVEIVRIWHGAQDR